MAERAEDILDTEPILGLVRAALDPDERKFFKAHLGQESPDIADYLMPKGRFKQARGLRDSIVRSVLTEAMKPRSTVGEAQSMFPGFPTPPGATRPGPQVETEQSLVPETFDIGKLQHGATAAASPGIDPMREFTGDIGQPYRMAPGQPTRPTFYTDPGMAPRQLDTQVVDREAILPRSYQHLLEQRQHREGLQPQRGGVTDAELKARNMVRLGQLRSGQSEAYPGELSDIEAELKLYELQPRPGSSKARTEAATADIKEVEAKNKPTREASEIDKIQSENALADARATEVNTLIKARLGEIIARTTLENAQAGRQGQQLADAESRNRLLEAGKDLDILKYLDARGLIDAKGQKAMLGSIVNKISKDLELMGQDPGPFQEMLGLTPKGVTLAPKASQPKPAQAPSLTPPPQPEEGQDDISMLKAMGAGMKEGEVKEYKGTKFRKKGNKLVKE